MINIDKILGQILNSGQMIDSNPFDGKSEGKPFDGKSLTGGLLVGGLAGALMGKSAKKFASSAMKLGGAAAVAGLAYSAYQRYRSGQMPSGSASTVAAPRPALEQERPASGPWGADVVDLKPLQEAHFLPVSNDTAATENLSLKLIRAMISAAKADGQIDGTESERIFNQIGTLGLNDEERSFLLTEINRPRSAREVAASAENPEEAAEIYAISVMAVNPNGLAERLYLGDLSRLLKLEPALANTIHDSIHHSSEGSKT